MLCTIDSIAVRLPRCVLSIDRIAASRSDQARDTSSAAIVCSALLALDQARPGAGYREQAAALLTSLAGFAAPHSQAVLDQNAHDCGDARCTVIETDYYFLEALLRYAK